MTVARQARLWQWAGVAYGACAVLFLFYFPTITISGQQFTLDQRYGPSVLVPISLPVLATLVPAALPWRKPLVAWIVAAALGVFIVVTIGGIGLVYLPSAVFTAVAAHLHGRAPIEDAPPEPDNWANRRL